MNSICSIVQTVLRFTLDFAFGETGINPFLANVLILYALKILENLPENLQFSGVFREYKMRTLARYTLTFQIMLNSSCLHDTMCNLNRFQPSIAFHIETSHLTFKLVSRYSMPLRKYICVSGKIFLSEVFIDYSFSFYRKYARKKY